MTPKVTLISYTQDADAILIFTKSTRLNMTPGLLDDIKSWPAERKREELEYMARTVPSSWEMCDYIFAIENVTRAFTHQLVRTRTGSYAQQAMRITQMGDENKPFAYSTGATVAADPLRQATYESIMRVLNHAYSNLIEKGASVEDARGVLPTNICTNIVAKFNLRTLSDLAVKRGTGRTQDEYRTVLNQMLEAVEAVHPWAGLFLRPKRHDTAKRVLALADRLRAEGHIDAANALTKEGEILSRELK